MAQIAASMVELGVTNPLLAGSDGVLVAGHGRLLAARKLGLTQVPVVVLGHLTPTHSRALVIADIRIAENAGWDQALLHLGLEALRAEDFDLSLTDFDPDDLADLLAGEETTTEGQTDDDDAPEAPETAVSRPGDVWLLGPHRVLCGDTTDPECYARLLGEERVDLVWQDPPYNVDYANSAKDKLRGTNRPILNDNLGDDFWPFFQAALSALPLTADTCDRDSVTRIVTGINSTQYPRLDSFVALLHCAGSSRKGGYDMMIQTKASWVLTLAGAAAVALALGPAPIAAGSKADVRDRPYGGSCNAAVTLLSNPGEFPEVLQVDLDCLLKHLGHTTGAGTTTVVPAGAPVGAMLPIFLTSETTYEAANGDLLYQTFSGTGTVNTETLEVQFEGMELFEGGTGRFVDAVGFAHSVGSASFVTNTGFLTTEGRLAY